IHVNTNFTDLKKTSKEQQQVDLKSQFEQLIKERNEDTSKLKWIDDETVEANISPLTLHSFVLKAESLGLKVQYKKKTIIEIV
ncbi:hypothetical protein, partial [Fulvivirga aurantia]|uniref:hypothetical protein n=1 Tax=Fulvivirga aurantia TaxID=2529383 RepID=UPI001624EC7E